MSAVCNPRRRPEIALAPSLREQALRLLARRDHSRAELARKLAAEDNNEEVASLLNSLEQSGLLSDARFAESFVRQRARRSGATRLRHELRLKGVDVELIEEAILRETVEQGQSEVDRARELWARKFGVAPADAKEYARQARYLAGRGFDAEIVRRLLRTPDAD